MTKTILVTGSTDGIGLLTARELAMQGHNIVLHGRNPEKLEKARKSLAELPGSGRITAHIADLSDLSAVAAFATAVREQHSKLDVLINNAGVFRSASAITQDGLDIRFAVNTIAPYLLTQRLLPLLSASGRVINLSSAAQSPVDTRALSGETKLTDEFNAYAQSKLALTMWSRNLAQSLAANGPAIIAVNPGSMLATKMVKEGFGGTGKDVNTGAEILVRAALTDEFAAASGQYFDNDKGLFAPPHPDALEVDKSQRVVEAIETVTAAITAEKIRHE